MLENLVEGLRDLAARWEMRLLVLAGIVAGLSYWSLRPEGRAEMPSANQLSEAASVGGYLLLIAAGAGVAAMATVQFWKVLFLPRAAFHAGELESLFHESTCQVLGVAAPTPGDAGSAWYWRRPGKPRDLKHLLDNPTEVVIGQLRSTADYILLQPKGFEEALRRLAGDAGEGAVETYLNQLKGEPANLASPDSIGGSSDALVEGPRPLREDVLPIDVLDSDDFIPPEITVWWLTRPVGPG